MFRISSPGLTKANMLKNNTGLAPGVTTTSSELASMFLVFDMYSAIVCLSFGIPAAGT